MKGALRKRELERELATDRQGLFGQQKEAAFREVENGMAHLPVDLCPHRNGAAGVEAFARLRALRATSHDQH
jgi:hypothetical protein